MHCYIIAAISIDGFIAKDPKVKSTTWTSKEDKAFFGQKTKESGVMIMGRKTYDTIGRPLPGRLNIVYTRDKSLEEGHDDRALRTTTLQPQELIKSLAQEGLTEVAICGGTSIYTQFLQSGVVDTLYLTVEPVVFGEGMKLFGEGVDERFSLVKTDLLNQNTLLLVYKLKRD